MDEGYRRDFLYFDEAIGRALYLSNPSAIAEYDRAVSVSGKIDSRSIGLVAQIISKNAVDVSSRRSVQIKELMMSTLLARFKIEAHIHSELRFD